MELPNSSSNSFCFSRCTWFEKTRTSCVAFKFFPFFFLSLSIGNIPPKHPTAKCKFRDPRRPGGKDLHRKWMECLNGEVSIDTTGIVSPPSRFFGTWEGGTFPYFLACWYRGYVSAPGDCLFCVEKWEKLMAVLVHASWLLSYWVFDMFTSMSGKFHRHPWQSMLHLHPLEDPATLIGSLIYTPWKFNISASISKVSISLSKAWTYPQHHCQETSKSKHITKKQCVYIYIYIEFQGCVHFAVDYPKLHSSPSLFKNAMILSPLKLPVATKPSNRRNPSKWTLGWLAVRLTGRAKAPATTKTKTSGLLSNHKHFYVSGKAVGFQGLSGL